MVKWFRQVCPGVGIVVRGTLVICRHQMLDCFERNGVRYIVGLARNAVPEGEISTRCDENR